MAEPKWAATLHNFISSTGGSSGVRLSFCHPVTGPVGAFLPQGEPQASSKELEVTSINILERSNKWLLCRRSRRLGGAVRSGVSGRVKLSDEDKLPPKLWPSPGSDSSVCATVSPITPETFHLLPNTSPLMLKTQNKFKFHEWILLIWWKMRLNQKSVCARTPALKARSSFCSGNYHKKKKQIARAMFPFPKFNWKEVKSTLNWGREERQKKCPLLWQDDRLPVTPPDTEIRLF